MKYRHLICAMLLASMPSLVVACGSAVADHLDQDERMSLSDFEDLQIEYLARILKIPRENLVMSTGAAFVHHIDLDGDGTTEICLSLQTSATCSNGVSVCHILVLKDWSTDPLLEFTGHLLGAEKLPEERWVRLVGVWAAVDGIIRKSHYNFNDRRYTAEPSVEIGSWSEQRCNLGEYEPLMLCSRNLIEALKHGI
ncbi:MAG: hypothetical protein ABJ327_02805 [Litoreibacter sp.]